MWSWYERCVLPVVKSWCFFAVRFFAVLWNEQAQAKWTGNPADGTIHGDFEDDFPFEYQR